MQLMTIPRSEWLRPIAERYLEGEAGRAPATVKLAAILSGLCALASGGLALVYVPMAVESVSGQVNLWRFVIAGPVAVAAVALFFAFAIGAGAIVTRGWHRIPFVSGLVLGALALASLWVVAGEPAADVSFVGLRAIPSAVAGFGLALLVRLPAANAWLAKRRYQSRPTPLR
jgi:hypothetical protein